MRVEAIILPERLDGLLAALEERGFVSVTVSDVIGRGEQRGIKLRYSGRAERCKLLSKVRIELIVCDYEVDFLIETIAEAVKTGKFGDGRIFVSPVTRSIKLRSGEDTARLETQSSEGGL